MTEWWVSSIRMTFWAGTVGSMVVATAPIGRKFVGQPFANLERWMRQQGGFRREQLK